MHRNRLVLVLGFLPVAAAAAAEPLPIRPAAFCPAENCPCVVVEEIVYKEVCKKVCRLVPDVRKTTRTVYDCRCEDYCLKRCPVCKCKSDCCDECSRSRCGRPRTKNILLKKIVTDETPTTKCEVVEVVEWVPIRVFRKVPCGNGRTAEAGVSHQLPVSPCLDAPAAPLPRR